MSKLPAIPEFTDDLHSLATAVRALKAAVEVIGGQRQGQSLGAPQMFVQTTGPMVSRTTALNFGDLWVNSATDQMYYWDGHEWRPLV